MLTDSATIARHLAQRARQAIDDGRALEGLDLFERAYTAAVAGNQATPMSFKLLPRGKLPQLSSEQHILAYLSQSGVVFCAMVDFIAHPCSDFRRFPMIGHLCSNVARSLSGSGTFQCVLDTGDGTDSGSYVRVAYSSTRPETVLILDPYFYIYENYDALRTHVANQARPWRDRQDILFWRGTTTGLRRRTPEPDAPLNWDWLPRLQLCANSRASHYAAKMDIAVTEMAQIGEPYLQDAIVAAGLLRPQVPKMEFLNYKYLIDIDGYSNSWSLIEKFIMGATVFKVKSADGFRQWYYHRLKDWETHIPIAADLSDLDERIGWALDHPQECERIATNGAALAADVQLSAAMTEAEGALAANLAPV